MKKLMRLFLIITLIASIFPMQGFAMEYNSKSSSNESKQNLYDTILKSMKNLDGTAKFNPDTYNYKEIGSIVNRVAWENPEIFYYNGVTVSSNGTIQFEYSDQKQSILKKKQKIDSTVNRIIKSKIKKNMSDLEKVKAIHDYLVLTVQYDYQHYLNNDVPKDSYGVYGALVNNTAVCDGYSKSMQLLLKRVGVQSIYVTGFGNGESHSWNLVKINGKYYHVDATWDDPVPNKTGVVNYNYFLLSNNQIRNDHSWNNNNYPTATSEKYTYFHSMENMIEKSGTYYYSNAQNGILYKMNKSSKKISKVVSDRAPHFAISGQWIYYSNYSNGGYLYKVKLNGKSKQLITDSHVVDIFVKNHTLFYKDNESGKMYKIVI